MSPEVCLVHIRGLVGWMHVWDWESYHRSSKVWAPLVPMRRTCNIYCFRPLFTIENGCCYCAELCYSSNMPQIWPLGLLFHDFVTCGRDFG